MDYCGNMFPFKLMLGIFAEFQQKEVYGGKEIGTYIYFSSNKIIFFICFTFFSFEFNF